MREGKTTKHNDIITTKGGGNSMYSTLGKKVLNILILKILQEHSDSEHLLSQQDIIDKLNQEYGVSCERHAVGSNIKLLKKLRYGIDVTPKGYYLADRIFEDAELVMLIDSVVFSKNLSHTQKKRLTDKLEKIGNKYFHSKVTHIANLPDFFHSENKQALIALDTISEAISKKKKIQFVYNKYGIDFKLHPRKNKEYIVSPYQLAMTNGKYYLIGNYDKYDDISHYRVDRITDVKILNEPVKPKKQIREFSQIGFDLPKHMAEHIYMYSGESVWITFLADVEMMDELVDWFGKNFSVTKLDDKKIRVRLKCNEQAMIYWALQYGNDIVIESPKSLIESVKNIAKKIVADYES